MSQSLQSGTIYDEDSSPIEAPPGFQTTTDPAHRQRKYILYTPTLHKEWHQWWDSTSWRKEHSEKDFTWDVTDHKSQAWQVMMPCANLRTGEPRI